MMKKILGVHFKWFWLFFAVGAGLTFAVGRYIEFHALSNDYWNILYYGRRMTLSEPESLYNGFYPFGYPFLIGQMPFTYVLPLSYILNALLSGLFTASVSTLILSTRSIPATILAFFSSIAAPFIFQNANTLSPDIGSAAFTAFAVYLLCRQWFDEDRTELDASQAILTGVSLGLSFLWRTHAAVSILAVLAGWLLLFGIRPFRPRFSCSARWRLSLECRWS
jgi:4-amino-4-deoxy-L-arabinose transferase-like glycosyltransferase